MHTRRTCLDVPGPACTSVCLHLCVSEPLRRSRDDSRPGPRNEGKGPSSRTPTSRPVFGQAGLRVVAVPSRGRLGSGQGGRRTRYFPATTHWNSRLFPRTVVESWFETVSESGRYPLRRGVQGRRPILTRTPEPDQRLEKGCLFRSNTGNSTRLVALETYPSIQSQVSSEW